MDQDLRSRIKAAAQERGLDPEIAVNFAKAESSLNPNAKAKTSSASGLFQVINKTWEQYGGGDKRDVNEQIRVGTDIIASNQASFKRKFNREPSAAELYAYHVLGPTGAPQLLRADPATPMEQIVSREAIKANPVWKGKTAGQVLGTYEKKVGSSQQPRVATQQTKPGMRPTNYSFEPLTQLDIENLGPGYQAGLAAMALGDTQDNDEDNIAERAQEAREDAENSMLADSGSRNVANLEFTYASPFPEEQPVMMAKGGEARKMMDAVYRADGSPEYGEISMGDFSGDTRQQLKDAVTKRGRATTKEDVRLLGQIPVQAASNAESFVRGSAAAIPGMVGDVEAAFRTDPKKQVFPTTERILKSVPRVTPANERSAGFEEIGTYDAGLAAVPVGRLVAKGAKVAAPIIAEKALKAAPAAQPMYAIKPSGGVFYPQGSGSRIDDYLDTVVKKIARTDIAGKDAIGVADFIRNKGHKYLTTTFGTGKDPIREAILDGRLTLTGKDTENIRGYALRAAREGEPEALKDVEKAYDELTKLRGNVITDSSKSSSLARTMRVDAAQEAEVAKMLKEGVDPDFINYNRATKDVADLGASYSPDAEKMLADFLSGKKKPTTGAEKAVLMAANKDERIYDLSLMSPAFDFFEPDTLARGIATIPVADLNRMSFPEAVIRGAQNTLLDRSGDAVVAAVEKGKSIPKKFYTEGVSPVKGAEDVGWVTIDTPFAARLEGALMKHSVGGYGEKGSYGLGGRDALVSGKAKVFSLRPTGGKPVTTVEASVKPEGLTITQVKAPYNSAPTPEEKLKVFQLFDTLRPAGFKGYPERYAASRKGEGVPESFIDWGAEYANYQKYLNKEIE
jgi:hypothetical protein